MQTSNEWSRDKKDKSFVLFTLLLKSTRSEVVSIQKIIKKKFFRFFQSICVDIVYQSNKSQPFSQSDMIEIFVNALNAEPIGSGYFYHQYWITMKDDIVSCMFWEHLLE